MSIILPTNDTDRLATAEDVLRVSSSKLSSSPVSIPDHEVSELRDAYRALQDDLRLEAVRKVKLKRMRAMASQRMPNLRQQVRSFWLAARFYIDNLISEQAMLRADASSSDQSSKPGDLDVPGEELVSDPPVEAETVQNWYHVPVGAPGRLKDTQWVAAARHLIQAIDRAPEANIPVFQTISSDQLLMQLDGLEEAVLFIANDYSNRSNRNLNSRSIRERMSNALATIALNIRFQCRGESREMIREKQRAFGFKVRLGSSGSSENQAGEDSSSVSADSGEGGSVDPGPMIQPTPNLEAEGTLG